MDEDPDFNWDIHEIILDCLTNPDEPTFPEYINYEEYNAEIHGPLIKLPNAAKHLIIAGFSHDSVLDNIEEAKSKTALNSASYMALDKLHKLATNHLDIIINLQVNLMEEVLIHEGLDAETVTPVILNDWNFSFVNKADNTPKVPSEEKRTLHNHTVH